MKQQDTINMNPSTLVSGGIFLAIITLVHVFYQGIVRPSAEAIIAIEGAAATGNLWVILKDFEQQACISIGLYCCFLMLYKSYRIKHEEKVYTWNFLAEFEEKGDVNIHDVLTSLENSSFKDSGAMSTWITCIKRYINTQNVLVDIDKGTWKAGWIIFCHDNWFRAVLSRLRSGQLHDVYDQPIQLFWLRAV